MENSPQYVIEMLHITKEFPGIKANDDITLQLRKGEIHALLGENGAAVPAGRCLPDFGGNRSYLLIDIGEHIGQVALDPSDQHILESLFDLF